MYIVLGIVLAIVGIIMLVNPKLFYDITEGWKNNSSAEPSELFIFSTRFGGVMFLVVGIGVTVALLFFA